MEPADFKKSNYSGKRSRPLIGFERGDQISDISNFGRVENNNLRLIPGPRHFDPHSPAPIHRGKGPKTYQKSDERILDDICRRMSENRYLDASDIEVKVGRHRLEVLHDPRLCVQAEKQKIRSAKLA